MRIAKSERQIKGKFRPRRPKSRKEEAEFGPGKIDILVCKKCGAFYWYKSWKARLSDYPELKQSKRIKFVSCPACQMIKDKKYEGEIILEAVPKDFKEDIENLAKNYGKRAIVADPMDRIIKITQEKEKIRILTTENQLAVRIAKKIKQSFGGEIKISYSHQEDVVRIRIKF
ncbi:MAG: hypothetical protein E3J36_00430 [Candidatus Nealsonbacteria bacterium]|nr:MAG: hypothetical protein E3J36_00430 [Candidatus Nealsonbacteria bacterium]